MVSLAVTALLAALAAPQTLVSLAEHVPGIAQDLRYAGPDNFLGHSAPGCADVRIWMDTYVYVHLCSSMSI